MSKLTELFTKPLETAADELASKFNTPFFTTFIFVWFVRNRLFIYDLFFSADVSIDRRDLLLKQFAFNKEFAWNSILTILVSLGLLVLFYVAVNISRVITMFSEERIKLNLFKKLKSKRLCSAEDVDFWRSGQRISQNIINDYEAEVARSSRELDKANEKIKTIKTQFNTSLHNINHLKKNIDIQFGVYDVTDVQSVVKVKKSKNLTVKEFEEKTLSITTSINEEIKNKFDFLKTV